MVEKSELPSNSLLVRYANSGAYTDCYSAIIRGSFSQAQYVNAFYTTPLFKLERLLLSWLISRPSTDAEVRGLASGETDSFAAWGVEERRDNQLLLSDLRGRTRSWLMCEPDDESTRLYFGSAVLPDPTAQGEPRLSLTFRLLLPFHKLYSRALLASARSRLRKDRR